MHWFGYKTTRKLSQEPTQNPRAAGERLANTVQIFNLQRLSVNRMPARNFSLANRKFVSRLWHKLHFKRLAKVPGSVVCVEFLKEDGTPRYKRPIWLFWTGPEDVTPQDLCRMYLWRFAIEHLFRFLKQHMGLNSNRSTNLESLQRWMWIVALAYWQLLLIRDTGHA
jgi:IS4 transposase